MSQIEVNSSDQNINLLNLSEGEKKSRPTFYADVPEGVDKSVGHVPSDAVINENLNVEVDPLTDAYFLKLLNDNSNDSDQVIEVTPASLLEKLKECSPEKSEINEEITDVIQNHHVNDTLYKILDQICEFKSQSIINIDDPSEIKNDEISNLQTECSELHTDDVKNLLHENLLIEKQQCTKEVDLKDTFVIETAPASPKEQKLEMFQLHRVANEHRDTESDWTDDESSSTSSSDSDFFFEPIPKVSITKVEPVKTKGELDIEDLPPIEELTISVNENELVKIGKVHAIVIKQVVIQAMKDKKALDMDSVLFLSCNKPLGRIFEVFGPVIEPFYVVLFNSPEDIINKGVTVGADVYFAPEKTEITSYVFVDLLRQQKGSDASWKDNNEPPEGCIEYSDDEEERIAKLRRKARNRAREDDDDDVQLIFPTSSETKMRKVSSSNDISGNYSGKKPRTEERAFPVRSSENVFQHPYNAGNNLNGTTSERYRFSSNQPSSSTSSSNNVPVWITPPTQFLAARSTSSQQNVFNLPPANCPPPHSPHTTGSPIYPQHSVSPLHPQHTVSPLHPQHTVSPIHLQPTVSPIHFQNSSNTQSLNPYFPQQQSSQSQLNQSPLLLLSKQPFVSHQMSNHNTPPPLVFQHQNPFSPIPRSANYLPPPQSPLQQNVSQPQSPYSTNLGNHNFMPPSQSLLVSQNVTHSSALHNYNQPHMFGQVTPIAAASPVIPFPSPSFSPRPAVFIPPNSMGPTNLFSTPPPNTSGLSSNCPIPPPRPPPSNNFYIRNYR